MNDLNLPDNPHQTLALIREKMGKVAEDFSHGVINRAQFNAMYSHYSEQQGIIERLIERNPNNDAWKHVASPGKTTFLRTHFEAQAVFFAVFKHRKPTPLMLGGKQPPKAKEQIVQIIKTLWNMDKIPTSGLARKAMGDGGWLVIAVGAEAVTVVVYSLQPSQHQTNRVRDMHTDFERANSLSLTRDSQPDKMVFPQRALIG